MRAAGVALRGQAMFAVLVVACAQPSETTPPTVLEPQQGAVVDRCLVRVRMNPPGDSLSFGNRVGVWIATGPHASWRLNGGVSMEVTKPTGILDSEAPFVFAVTLVPGANHLEVGRRDGP